MEIFKKANLKFIGIMLAALLLVSSFSVSVNCEQSKEAAVLINTDFSDWETNRNNLLVAGSNAQISYEYDSMLNRNVVVATLPKGLNGSNSVYVPALLEKGKEYKVYIVYRITAWSCISYNGASSWDGGKPLDSYCWNSAYYTFTPTADNCYFRIGTNQDNYKIHIAEIKLYETVSVAVQTSENGTGTVSESSTGIGDKVTFSALPDSGYVFECWKDSDGNTVSYDATYEHTVTGAVTLTPYFSPYVFEYYFENFEDGKLFDGGYTTSSSYVISPTPDSSSDYCFKHTYISSNTYYYIKTPSLPAGNTYEVKFKCYSQDSNKWFRFDVYDSSGAHTSVSRQGVWAIADCWTDITFELTPPSDGWYVGFLMSEEIYIDDFIIANTAFEGEIIPDTPEESEITVEIGDFNADGKINIKDLVRAKKNISQNEDCCYYFDVNYDSTLNSLDLSLLSKFLVGKVEYFPVGGIEPYAVTLTMYDEESYGVTWNTNGMPSDSVVQICEGETFSISDCEEIPASVTKETTYNKSNELQTDYYVLKATLSGLEEGKTYTYRCIDKKFGNHSQEFTFTVKNREPESFKFIHVSDSQAIASSYLDPIGDGTGSGWAYANTLKGIESGGDYDFILHTGDVVQYSKYESYWRNMIDLNSKYFAEIPVMPLTGNHDTSEYSMFKHFNIELPQQDKTSGIYYSFDYGNAKFIMLNTNNLTDNKIKDDQYNWLEETLKNNSKKWLIVSMHNPMYSVGKWGANSSYNTISLSLRSQLSDLFAEYGVDIVLQGHDHTYSKTYPIGSGFEAETSLEYENISGIDYCTNVNGVIYVMNGAAGDQLRTVVEADEGLYELSGDSDRSSWAEIEVSQDKLSVKVYRYDVYTEQPVLWNSYGIK